jgi:hypothetical protein
MLICVFLVDENVSRNVLREVTNDGLQKEIQI